MRNLYHYVIVGRHYGNDEPVYEAGVAVLGLLCLLVLPMAAYIWLGPWATVGVVVIDILIVLKLQRDTNKALGPRKKDQ